MTTKTPKETIDELKQLVVGYARQETLGPIKNLGSWVGFGLGGVLLFALAALFWALTVLRLLQSFSFTDGNLSWIPYLAVSLLLIAAIGICANAMMKRPEWLEDEVQ